MNTDIRKSLEPCIKVISGKYHRSLLRTIIDAYHRETLGKTTSKLLEKAGVEGAYLYKLYELGEFKSKSKVEAALKDLVECGYLTCVEAKVKGRKRKIYRPTPLGVAMDYFLTLLYPKERNITVDVPFHIGKEYSTSWAQFIYAMVLWGTGVTLEELTPYILHWMIITNLRQMNITSPLEPPSLPPLVKGYQTLEYAVDLVHRKFLISADWRVTIALLQLSFAQKYTWEIIEKHLNEKLKYLEEVKERLEPLLEWFSGEFRRRANLELPTEVKNSIVKLVNELYKTYKLLDELHKVHREGNNKAQTNSRVS
ncbi:MAG: hypothetical protein LM600_05075 [Thaumarchaeota archaeon]|nr:hypothetical protein [Nitrososphaerota archaeon]